MTPPMRTRAELLQGVEPVKVEPRRERVRREGVEPKTVTIAGIAEAKRMLANAPAAVEGQGGQAHTGVVCIRTLALIPDPAVALEAMRSWNARCEPPWDEEELLDRLQRAAVEADVEPGSRAEMALARANALAEADELTDPSGSSSPGVTNRGGSPGTVLYHPTEAKRLIAAQEFEDFDDDNQSRTYTEARAHLGLWRAGTRQNVVGPR